MRSSTFCRADRQMLTPLPTMSPHGASIFWAPKSSRSFQPELASLSSPLVQRLEPGGEPGLLPSVRVPGSSASSAGLGATPEGSPALSHDCRCRPCLVAVGQMGGPSASLEPLPCSPSWWAHWRWTHFDSIRGTPCSTVATVAPGQSRRARPSAVGAMTR